MQRLHCLQWLFLIIKNRYGIDTNGHICHNADKQHLSSLHCGVDQIPEFQSTNLSASEKLDNCSAKTFQLAAEQLITEKSIRRCASLQLDRFIFTNPSISNIFDVACSLCSIVRSFRLPCAHVPSGKAVRQTCFFIRGKILISAEIC